MSLYGVIGYHVTLSEGHMIANHPIYGVIGYHVPITPYKETLVPHLVAALIYLSQNYSYHIRGNRSPLKVDYFKVYLEDLSIFYGVFFELVCWSREMSATCIHGLFCCFISANMSRNGRKHTNLCWDNNGI